MFVRARLPSVAHAPAPRRDSSRRLQLSTALAWRRHECRRGTHECVRYKNTEPYNRLRIQNPTKPTAAAPAQNGVSDRRISPARLKNCPIPSGETWIGRHGKNSRAVSKGYSSITPGPPSVSISSSGWVTAHSAQSNPSRIPFRRTLQPARSTPPENSRMKKLRARTASWRGSPRPSMMYVSKPAPPRANRPRDRPLAAAAGKASDASPRNADADAIYQIPNDLPPAARCPSRYRLTIEIQNLARHQSVCRTYPRENNRR